MRVHERHHTLVRRVLPTARVGGSHRKCSLLTLLRRQSLHHHRSRCCLRPTPRRCQAGCRGESWGQVRGAPRRRLLSPRIQTGAGSVDSRLNYCFPLSSRSKAEARDRRAAGPQRPDGPGSPRRCRCHLRGGAAGTGPGIWELGNYWAAGGDLLLHRPHRSPRRPWGGRR